MSAGAVEYDAKAAAERAIKWMQSPKGQRALRKAAADAKALADKFRAARNISDELLHRRYTI